ncbi:DUF559 domain-containing protein [Nocardioides pelophilus]|uniref:DUF559 domain-containing protein n=1 Tax=Nocardioides pelophilus TaxID=2172019 RepID=UPI00160473A1|nr:DUF559 domain-containing protein [Nocardioides pelophilus]
MTTSNRSTAERRRRHRAAAESLADGQGGVVTREQLHVLGMSSAAIAANLDAGRWQELGVHCIVVHTGPLSEHARWWAAVLESGPRAYIDGESSLVCAGLEHYTPHAIRVTVPRGARVRHRGTGVDIRQTRRWDLEDVVADPVPRSRNPVAAVRACLWARTERQAQLLVTMTVQQGLARVEDIAAAALTVRRDRRRTLLGDLLIDLDGGIGSLSELDVLRGCRERGLPEPDRQALRRTSRGSYFLDFRWKEWAVVVEVDGIHHAWAQNLVADALRHNTLAIEGDIVLRLPVLGLRLCPDEFFAQIEAALRRAGWTPGVAAA